MFPGFETPPKIFPSPSFRKPTVAHWGELPTEQRNQASARIDEVSTKEMLRIMNREDASVAAAVEKELGQVAEAVELVVSALGDTGRLFYIGQVRADASVCWMPRSAPLPSTPIPRGFRG